MCDKRHHDGYSSEGSEHGYVQGAGGIEAKKDVGDVQKTDQNKFAISTLFKFVVEKYTGHARLPEHEKGHRGKVEFRQDDFVENDNQKGACHVQGDRRPVHFSFTQQIHISCFYKNEMDL